MDNQISIENYLLALRILTQRSSKSFDMPIELENFIEDELRKLSSISEFNFYLRLEQE